MKKFLLSLALVAMALPFTSCTNDEPATPEEPVKETVVGKDLISWVIKADDCTTNYVETAEYTFNIERGKDEAIVSVVANNVKFDSHMPVRVSFRMENIKTTKFDENYIEFKASSVKFLDPITDYDDEHPGFKITNVKGYIDKKNNIYSLDYTIDASAVGYSTWRVLVCNSTVSTRVSDNDYSAASDLYYTYKIDIEKMKAEVFIYNVQFQVGGAMSPVLKKISIPNLDVEFTTTTYSEYTGEDDGVIDPVIELKGDEIVPTYYTGANLDQETPYPALMVTNFKSILNIANGFHIIFFNCHGGEHSNFGNDVNDVMGNNFYLWHWEQGSIPQKQ
ncbi:MAG: hypothetical protein IKT03_08185 [Muribaculaceae bacterium]|nr:hypothetical protein [Muribaculaceae bacterium]